MHCQHRWRCREALLSCLLVRVWLGKNLNLKPSAPSAILFSRIWNDFFFAASWVFPPWWIFLSVEIQFLWNGPYIINGGTHGYYANHVRHDKFLPARKFNGASAAHYVLIVIWSHCELQEKWFSWRYSIQIVCRGIFSIALQASHSSLVLGAFLICQLDRLSSGWYLFLSALAENL